jgi:hypothetical protein
MAAEVLSRLLFSLPSYALSCFSVLTIVERSARALILLTLFINKMHDSGATEPGTYDIGNGIEKITTVTEQKVLQERAPDIRCSFLRCQYNM